jgi:hypothetical protein
MSGVRSKRQGGSVTPQLLCSWYELIHDHWLPRKALLEAPTKDVPNAIRAWVRFAGR